jgi:hypothetical protein
MEFATQSVELALQLRFIDIQLARKPEEREVIGRHRRLNLAARRAEARSPHIATRPALVRRLVFHCKCRIVFFGLHHVSTASPSDAVVQDSFWPAPPKGSTGPSNRASLESEAFETNSIEKEFF